MAVAAAFKVMFLIFTLSLVCVTNSLMDKNKLEKLKEDYEELQTLMDQAKTEYMIWMEEVKELRKGLNQKMALRQEEMKKTFPDFLPLDTYFENNKRYLEQFYDYMNNKYEDLGEKIEDREEKVREMGNLIKFIEENQAEL